MTLAEMLGYIVQPLGGPVIPILPKAQSNATGGSIPGVPGPKGPPLSSPAEMMAALTAIGNAQYESELRKAQAEKERATAGLFKSAIELGGSGPTYTTGGAATPAAWGSLGAPDVGGAAAPVRMALDFGAPGEYGAAQDVGAGGGPLSLDQMTQLASRAGFAPGKDVQMAAIAMGESSGNPSAYNGRGENSYGITQINADAHGPKAREALNPQRAMELAFDISKGGTDFSPWSVYKSGAYKKYMQTADAGSQGTAYVPLSSQVAAGLPTLSSKFVFGTPGAPTNAGRIDPGAVPSYGVPQPGQANSAIPPGYKPPPPLAGAAALANVSQPAPPGAPISLAQAGAPMSLAPVIPPVPQPQAGGMPRLDEASLARARRMENIYGILGKKMPTWAEEGVKMAPGGSLSPEYLGTAAGAKRGGEYPYDTATAQFKADLDARYAAIAADAARVNADLLAGRTTGPGGVVLPRPGFAGTEAGLKGGVAGAEAAARTPIEMARDRFKAQLDTFQQANRVVELAPGAVADINPNRFALPQVPGAQPGGMPAAAPGAAAALPGTPAGVVLRGADPAERRFGEEVAQQNAKQFFERRKLADDAVKLAESSQDARRLLDSGVITGVGANYILNLGRVLSQAGLSNGESVANTQAFIASRATAVGNMISAFGSGTAISDADREFTTKAVGGDITIDEKSIRRILDINDKVARESLRRFNEDAAKVDPKLSPYPLTVAPPTTPGRSGVTSGGIKWSRD